MQSFVDRHQDDIDGVLSGFDRVLFAGSAIGIGYVKGMNEKLLELGIPYKRFWTFTKRVTKTIKDHAHHVAESEGRPYLYLHSWTDSKETIARGIQQQDNIQEGLICVLACVESCQTYSLRRSGKNNWLTLVSKRGKCLFVYFYLMHPEFGFMHVRVQTWLPMRIYVCLNGREYLARRLDRAGIGYEKRDNCFTRIDDIPRAQQMMDDLIRRNWWYSLTRLARQFNPWSRPGNQLGFRGYYWTFEQSEFATDVMFRDAAGLAKIYPHLVRHGMDHFHARDVSRFFSGKTRIRGREITTDIKHRPEGVRIKHQVEENSIKMYDKQGSVLRVETTINKPCRFKVRRQAVRRGKPTFDWFQLRKGVVDIERRVEICRAANGRYLEALAVVGDTTPARDLLDPVSRPIRRQGRRYRALRPLERNEARMMQVLLSGRFHVQGFRNRDIYTEIHGKRRHSKAERRRQSARITRWLRLLRAHGLIRKVPHTFYYRVTAKGQRVMATAIKLRQYNLLQLAA